MRAIAAAFSIAYSAALFTVCYSVGSLFPYGLLVFALSIFAFWGDTGSEHVTVYH